MKSFRPLLFVCGFALAAPAAFAQETVDIQWSVCDFAPENVVRKLDLDENDSKQGLVTYFDTAPPHYIQDGITFRVKQWKSKNESSLKIRFDRSEALGDDFDCEFDRYGSSQEYTCELTGKEDDGTPDWSKKQRKFVAKYHGDEVFPDLQSFGPYADRKWKFKNDGRKVAFDSVDVPGVGHLMEFSIKVNQDEADDVQAAFTQFLDSRNVKLCSVQESKTLRLFRAMGSLKE